MERSSKGMEGHDEKDGLTKPLLDAPSSKGGFRTLPFILANVGLHSAANTGIEPNMIVYLMHIYGLKMATGSNIIFLRSAIGNFTPILCAFLADSYVGRFPMIGFGSILNLMGMLSLLATTLLPGTQSSCNDKNACTSNSNPLSLIVLCSSFAMISIGGGGIRSSIIAFGADQIVSTNEDNKTPSHPSATLENFFNLYYLTISFSLLFAFTCLVYIQDHMGWKIGFGVPVLLMFLSVVSFFLASSFYVKSKPKDNFFTGIAQVLVVSWKNRHYKFSSHENTEDVYYVAKGSTLQSPSEDLRFLNKACLIQNPRHELFQERMDHRDPWHLCTTEQVEELKSVINVIPLWSTGIIFGVNMMQSSFLVVQANSMDRHLMSLDFEIPAGSLGTFALIAVIIWLFLYNHVIIPLMSKVMGKSICLDVKTRMGIGLILSFLSMVVAGIVENVRRKMAIGNPTSIETMSSLWLIPQVCLTGLSEAINAIAQIEFFYTEFPKSMSSIASNLSGLGMSISSLIASIVMSVVDSASKSGGNESWICGDINKGHYDYYYWILSGLSLLNYLYFLFCSKAYGHKKKAFHDTKETYV